MDARGSLLPILGLLWLAGIAGAQDQSLDAMLERAAQLQRDGDDEAAAELLRDARRDAAAIEDPAERRKRTSAIEGRLKRVDPLDKKALRNREQAAQLMYDTGAAYLEKGWKRTALPFLQQAERLLPGIAIEKLAELRSDAAWVVGIAKFFQDAETYGDPWIIEGEEVVSPRLPDRSLMLMSKAALEGDMRVGFDALLGDRPGKLALVFGHDLNWSKQSFYILEVFQMSDETVVRVMSNDGATGRMTVQDESVLHPTAEERAGWINLTVELRGDEIVAQFGGREVARCNATGAPLPGAIGIYISSDSENKEPIRFRNLLVEPL